MSNNQYSYTKEDKNFVSDEEEFIQKINEDEIEEEYETEDEKVNNKEKKNKI